VKFPFIASFIVNSLLQEDIKESHWMKFWHYTRSWVLECLRRVL